MDAQNLSPVGRAAVFSDVEGTLVAASLPRLAVDTGWQLGLYSPRQRAALAALGALERVLPEKLARRAQMASVILAMAGRTDAEVERWLSRLVPAAQARIKPRALQRLQAHQAAGLPLVLVSGAFHEAIAQLGMALGGRGEGTKIQRRDGVYQARVDGAICQGEAKAKRALAVAAEMGYDPAQCYAYGDTASDIPFLAAFGHPGVVDPDPRLSAEADMRGWNVMRTGESG